MRALFCVAVLLLGASLVAGEKEKMKVTILASTREAQQVVGKLRRLQRQQGGALACGTPA